VYGIWNGTDDRKCHFTSGINFLIKLAAFVKEKALGDDQSLKQRWMKFE
jgi:hypothetical protein